MYYASKGSEFKEFIQYMLWINNIELTGAKFTSSYAVEDRLTIWLDMTSSSSLIFSRSKVLPLMSSSFKHPLPFPVSLQLDSFFHYFLCLSPHHLLPLSLHVCSTSSSRALLSR